MRSGNYHKICTLCVALPRGQMCGGGGGVELLVKISSSSPDSSGELLLCLFSSFGTKKKGGIRLPGGGGQYSISVVTEREVVPVVLKASILAGPAVAVVGDYAGVALDGGVVVGRPKRRDVRSRR